MQDYGEFCGLALKELEEDGLVVRKARTGSDRSVVYRARDAFGIANSNDLSLFDRHDPGQRGQLQ
jgi:hypothetical protein